jgi:hypothetical protein
VEDLFVIINVGYRKGATRPVLIQVAKEWVTREMPTFAPLAMAGNSPHLPDDTVSRQLRVLLLPDIDGETEDTDWEVLDPVVKTLHDEIAAWAKANLDVVKGMAVDLPDGCRGRLGEKWRPLKRVAVAAGGAWPKMVDQMAKADVAEKQIEREAGLKTQPVGVVLMTDLCAVWPEKEFVPTAELLKLLIVHNDSYWGNGNSFNKELTGKRLSNMVIKAANTRPTREVGTGIHGYVRSDFVLAWHRLGVGLSYNPTDPSDPSDPTESDGFDASDGFDGS